MGFRSFLAKRLAVSFGMLVVILILNFTIFMIMPGDPISLFIPPSRGTSQGRAELVARLKARWGLDKPIEQRVFIYIGNMFTFQFGDSLMSNRPINDELGLRVWYTLELMGGVTIISIFLGVVLGSYVAYNRGSKLDTVLVTSSLVSFSLPVFWIGLVFILVFTIYLGWLPHANAFPYDWGLPGRMPVAFSVGSTVSPQWNGNVSFLVNPAEFMELLSGYLRHLVLPLTTLTLFQYGGYLLLARATMIEALTEDYVVTARAKGVEERSIVFRHALKNASLPLITQAALAFGFMLSGAMITEGVFSWPGLGRWIFTAISLNDYTVLQAAFYIIALCVVLANVVADLLYGIIDPRIKYGR